MTFKQVIVHRMKTDARATRVEGIATRRRILDHAVSLFVESGLGGVSLRTIANAADVFPSQVNYYFESKEALFVEAACREALHIGNAVEKAGSGATSPEEYVSAILRAAFDSPSLLLFAEAMSVARFHSSLKEQVGETLGQLHREGERAVAETLALHDWSLRTSPAVEAEAYWATVLGVALQQAALPPGSTFGAAESVISLFFSIYPDSSEQPATKIH